MTPPWVMRRCRPAPREATNRSTVEAKASTVPPPGARKPSKDSSPFFVTSSRSHHRMPSRSPKSNSRSRGVAVADTPMWDAVSTARRRSEHQIESYDSFAMAPNASACTMPVALNGRSVRPV